MIHELEFNHNLFAEVSSSRVAEDGTWILQCSYYPEHILSRLATVGHIERRNEPRYPVCLPTEVGWQPEEPGTPVTLRDYSAGGFCVLADRAASPGQRLVLILDGSGGGQASIPATVQWAMKTAEGHAGGCVFLDRDDYDTFKEYAISAPSDEAGQSNSSR